MLRRFPNVRRLLFALPALILVAGGVVFFFNYRQEAALRALVAETTASDPGWQLADILAARPKAESGETVVSVISKWAMPLNSIALKARQAGNVTEYQATKEIQETPNCQPLPTQIAAIRLVDPIQMTAMVDFERLPDLPMGTSPIDPAHPMRALTSFYNVGPGLAAGQLQASALVKINDGDVTGSLRNLHAMFQASRCAGQHPGVDLLAIRMSTDRLAACTAEHLLAQLPLADEQLAELCKAVSDLLADRVAERALQSQRAVQFAGYEVAAESVDERWRIARGSVVRRVGFLTGSLLREEQALFLRKMNEWVNITRLPVEKQSKALIALPLLDDGIPLEGMFGTRTPQFKLEEDIRRQAMLRCMLVALAAERYRLARGQWPERLEQLVPAGFLKSLPADPFDGQPLGWKETSFGRIVVANGSDPRASTETARLYSSPTGLIGFRLFNPDQRRRPAPSP